MRNRGKGLCEKQGDEGPRRCGERGSRTGGVPKERGGLGKGVPEERGVPRERGEHRPARSGAVRGRPEAQRGGTRPEGRRTRDSPSPA